VQVTDWKDSSPEKTYNMLMGKLNPTHSLTEWLYPQLQQSLDCGLEVLTITVTFTRRCEIHNQNEKSTQGDANTARALAVVRFGHRPLACPPVANTQTHKQD